MLTRKRSRFPVPVLFVALALFLGAVAPPLSRAAYTVTKNFAQVTLTAGEALTAGDLVAIKSADGKAYKADADDATLRPAVGLVLLSAASAKPVHVVVVGTAKGWTNLTKGALLYLSGTAGAVTQAAPGWNQPVGVATSATTVFVNFVNYLDTSAITALGTQSQPTIYEGTTADEFELTVDPGDPTADRTALYPDASGTVMLSTLATNAPEAANACWGVSNGLRCEGATANDFETTFTPTDPTADRTVTWPDATGTVAFTTGVGSYRSFTIATDNVVLTTADCGKVYGIGTDAKTFTLHATAAGCEYTFVNTGANANNLVELVPDAADKVTGETRIANGTRLTIAGADGEHILNTKASALRGDWMRLVGDGVDGWYILGSAGIWAEASP